MTQASLFERLPARVRGAREAGHEASEQCAAKAERDTTFSTHRAREWVLQHLDHHGPTSGEDLVDGMKLAGMTPHDDRAFGVVFQSLVRDARITKYGESLRRKGHGTHGGVIWRIVR